MKFRMALVLVVSLALSACASSGQKMQQENLQALQPGSTTLEQMKQEFGPPISQTFDNEGNLVVNWSYVHVGAFGIGSEQQTLSAMFDSDGVLKRYNAMNGSQPGARLGY
ncbi:hypothetical protein [Kushneria marisflavi]|uniref:hypothetical protein n=1 Tax=Kushneria marisflavi TaxID=157779 RepID=UPI000FF4089E|nr:hypothetical protein [Kushneria marisflavi]RKD75784.1 hypothetical protein C8D96_3358 [Kushneria marisflavi]